MRILSIHSGGEILRGSELVLLDLLTRVQKAGHEVHLLCDQDPMRDEARARGIEASPVTRAELMIDPPTYQFQPIGLIRSNLQVRAAIKRFEPDVLYCNGARAMQMSIAASKLTGTPAAVHLHAPYPKRYLIGLGVTRAELVIHCSETIRLKHEQRAGLRRSETLLNALDDSHLPPLDQLRRPDGVPVIGFIGSLIHRKGIDILLQAAQILQRRGVAFKLRLAGTETDGQYREMATALGVRAEFVGEVKREKVPEFFAGIHLNVLASRSDAFGLTLIEGAAMGVPGLATTVGGVPEALLHGRLGVLYSDNTPASLADQIQSMLESDWMTQGRSHEIARLARKEFRWDDRAHQLCDMFASLCEGPASSPVPMPD